MSDARTSETQVWHLTEDGMELWSGKAAADSRDLYVQYSDYDRLRSVAARVARFQTSEEYANAIEELDAALHSQLEFTT